MAALLADAEASGCTFVFNSPIAGGEITRSNEIILHVEQVINDQTRLNALLKSHL